jgi:hypothetical protein
LLWGRAHRAASRPARSLQRNRRRLEVAGVGGAWHGRKRRQRQGGGGREPLARRRRVAGSGGHSTACIADFQLQRPDGSGVSLDDYVSGTLESSRPAALVDLVATSFSNTMITRCKLRLDDKVSPRLIVFQRIDGEWRAAADAE